MKLFVFLYPCDEYLKHATFSIGRGSPGYYSVALERLRVLIKWRYRRRGYQVYWVAHPHPETMKIDFESLDPRFGIEREDTIINGGVSIDEWTRGVIYDHRIPFAQLPPRIGQMVVGGFHNSDCVEKFAQYAHNLGIPSLVDEDTTELFFVGWELGRKPPYTREYLTPEDFGLGPSENPNKGFEESTRRLLLQWQVEDRENKPWRMPIQVPHGK